MIAEQFLVRSLVVAVAAAFALAGCATTATDELSGPQADRPAETIAPEPEPEPESEPVPVAEPTEDIVARGNGCQAPAIPPPPSGFLVLDDDCISVTVPAGGIYWFHGDQILQQQNIQPPSCPGFGSSFSWQVTSVGQTPMDLFIAPQGDHQPPVSGVSGSIDGYCGTVAAEHSEPTAVTMDLRYILVDHCPGC